MASNAATGASDDLQQPTQTLTPPTSETRISSTATPPIRNETHQPLPDKEKSEYENSCFNKNYSLVSNYVKRILDDFPTPSERYYDIRLVSCLNRRSFFGEVGDQCIMFHSNRICLITLAPTHPVISDDKTISRIEHTFEGFEKIDRLSSKPQGKSKKGGQKLSKNAPVCAIICSDGSKYVITAGIGSKLIEINELIRTQPNLVKERPLSEGFIAIVQPNDWKRMADIRDGLPRLSGKTEISCYGEV